MRPGPRPGPDRLRRHGVFCTDDIGRSCWPIPAIDLGRICLPPHLAFSSLGRRPAGRQHVNLRKAPGAIAGRRTDSDRRRGAGRRVFPVFQIPFTGLLSRNFRRADRGRSGGPCLCSPASKPTLEAADCRLFTPCSWRGPGPGESAGAVLATHHPMTAEPRLCRWPEVTAADRTGGRDRDRDWARPVPWRMQSRRAGEPRSRWGRDDTSPGFLGAVLLLLLFEGIHRRKRHDPYAPGTGV